MVSIKQGVKLKKLVPQMAIAVSIIQWCYIDKGYDTTITCGNEGHAGKVSKHNTGEALDFRINHIPSSDVVKSVSLSIGVNLGDNFDVVLEKDHIHVEYDPKVVK